MKRIVLGLLCSVWALGALAADNIVINQANGNFAIIKTTEAGGVHTINVSCPTCSSSSGITIGTTTITSGTTGRPLYDNSGVVGEYAAIPATFGGTGVANNVANTLTWSGAFASTFTLTGVTGVTFPTSGTLATTAGLTPNAITALTGDVTATGPGSVAATLATAQPGAHTWAAAQTLSLGAIIATGQTLAWSTDLFLQRDAANTLALRNGTTAQLLRVYGSWTDASNGDWLEFSKAAAGAAYIRTVKNGSGVASTLSLGVGGANFWTIDTSGNLIAVTDNASDFGASGATRPRTGYFGTSVVVPTVVVASAVQIANGAFLQWSTNSTKITDSNSNGDLLITNQAGTGFTKIMFGGTTSSFPAIKRSTTFLQARLADDSGFTDVFLRTVVTSSFTVATLPTAGTVGRRAMVSDQTAACVATGAALTGGGAVVCPVFDNGSAWVGGWMSFFCIGARRRREDNDNEQERLVA